MNKKIEGTDIHIGDIVQLKSAEIARIYNTEIPYMVVVEVVKEKIEGVSRFKYHCVWFIRRKVWEFKYAWLTSVTLDRVPKKNEGIASPKFDIGSIVLLSSLDNEEDADTENLTPFCPPVLIITGFETPKNQAPIFDSNSNVIREVPTLSAKCLYFNPISNKYSEILLPLEVLRI